MFKAEVIKEEKGRSINIEIASTLPEVCQEITDIIKAVYERFDEQKSGIAEAFKEMLTFGIMEGWAFKTNREDMESTLDKARHERETGGEIVELLTGILADLKARRGELVKSKEELDRLKEEGDKMIDAALQEKMTGEEPDGGKEDDND